MSSGSADGFRAFVSESEIEERRKKRQEEWEKNRKPDDPLEAPEEVYDPRPLYERLQEQKIKKQEEYEESKKLKNMIKGLDNDEISFLEMVDNTKMQLETQIWKEEMKEIEEYRKAMAHLSQAEQENRLREIKKECLNQKQNKKCEFEKPKKTQSELLAGVVKKRSSSCGVAERVEKKLRSSPESAETTSEASTKEFPTLKCIGILPGLGNYISDSSDSEDSSNEENLDDRDISLIVRKPRKKEEAKDQNVQK